MHCARALEDPLPKTRNKTSRHAHRQGRCRHGDALPAAGREEDRCTDALSAAAAAASAGRHPAGHPDHGWLTARERGL